MLRVSLGILQCWHNASKINYLRYTTGGTAVTDSDNANAAFECFEAFEDRVRGLLPDCFVH